MKRDWFVSALVGAVVAAATSFAVSPPFSTIWNSSYEAIPSDTEQESLGASRIRDLKAQLRLRLSQDHSWNGDGNDGYHKQVTLLQQTSAPTPAFDLGQTGGELFTESVGGNAELFYADNNNRVAQLTSLGALIATVPPGTVVYTAGAATPAGWLLANGAAVSRTTYANLFANIGTQYGTGDGSTTFNLPDCRARFIAGGDASNNTGRLTGLTNGISAAVLGNTGGEQAHTLSIAEMPSHNHSATSTVIDPGHSHNVNVNFNTGGSGGNGVFNGATPVATTTSTTGISVNTSIGTNGGGGGHNNIPPAIIFNCIIKQ